MSKAKTVQPTNGSRESEFYTEHGWNTKILDNSIELMGLLRGVAEVQYELKHCVRGSYAQFGTTARDLVVRIRQLAKDAEMVAGQMDEFLS